MQVFLSRNEKEKLSRWKYNVTDNSIVSEYLDPMFNYMTSLVPNNVAPNVLTLSGLLCTLYGFYLCYNYHATYPSLVSLCLGLLTFAYMCLDACDGKHARKTGNSTPLGELFDHSCDNIGVVFMMLSFCYVFGITNALTQWYVIQTSQLIFLESHITAFKNKCVKFGRYTSPGEFLCLMITLCFMRSIVPFSLNLVISYIAQYAYYGTFGYLIYVVSNIKGHYATRNGLLISLGITLIPALLIYYGVMSSGVNMLTVIGNGIILSVLTGDIIISKMTERELHPLVPVLIMLSLFDNFISIILTFCYYISTLTEISYFLRIPLFNVNHNVFCNGVYDLCHEGHMNLFMRASEFGTRLIVGVHNDETVMSYKRKPTMTHQERCNVVSKCKYVDEVIPNAELIIDEEFIKKHNIHTVACSAEYDSPDDKWYAVPRKLGILKVLPRTEGISTSDLMKRLKN